MTFSVNYYQSFEDNVHLVYVSQDCNSSWWWSPHLLNNVRLSYVFWELRISVTDEKQSFEEWYGLKVCISRLYNNVYIGWMNKVIMADGEDMIITWSRPREPLVRRHRVHVRERATHVKKRMISLIIINTCDIYLLRVRFVLEAYDLDVLPASDSLEANKETAVPHIPLLVWDNVSQPCGFQH